MESSGGRIFEPGVWEHLKFFLKTWQDSAEKINGKKTAWEKAVVVVTMTSCLFIRNKKK